MAFDFAAARAAGYTADEIRDYLGVPKGPLPVGAEGFAPALREELQGQDWLTRNIAGAGSAVQTAAEGIKDLFGKGDQRNIEAQRIIAEEAPVGNIAGNVAMLAPSMMIPGAATVPGAALIGATTGAVLTPGSVGDRAKAAAFGGVGGAAGAGLGRLAQNVAQRTGGAVSAAEQQAAQRAVANQPMQDLVEQSRQAGYVIPPSTVNPSAMNRALESLGGKVATQQTASIRNQEVTNRLARRALGLAEDTPLTSDVFKNVRGQAGKVYEELKNIGQFNADQKFINELDSVLSKTQSKGGFDVLKNQQIDDLVSQLKVGSFDSGDAVELMKVLRESASSNQSAIGDTLKNQLGRAQKQVAKSLEDLVSRNLTAYEQAAPGRGFGDLASRFSKARTQIAKTKNLEKATEAVSGNVDARKLGAMLQRGAPLSDDLRMIASFGRTFNKAAQVPERGGSPVSATQALASVLLGGAGGSIAGPAGMAAAALPLARPIARRALLSNRFQSGLNMPTGGPSGSLRLADLIAEAAANNPQLASLLGIGASR